MMHISDTHISVGQGDSQEKFELLQNALQTARAANAECIVHTGDGIHGEDPAAVTSLQAVLGDVGLPFYFISGNADWMLSEQSAADAAAAANNVEPNADSQPDPTPTEIQVLRQQRLLRTVTPLYRGAGLSHWVRELPAGLTVVGVDNSSGVVDAEQLEAVRSVDAKHKPWVLLCHIPLHLPSMKAALPGTIFCGEEGCGGQPTTATTKGFVQLLQQSTSVVAVLCGHIHQAQAHRLHQEADDESGSRKTTSGGGGGGVMLVTAATKDGGSRLLDFVPAPVAAKM